jgi:uncharacterized protein YqjF (DUF2071 family)
MLSFRSLVRDCLYLNWSVARDCLPALPEPLRYEVRGGPGNESGFVSAVLFRQAGMRLGALPIPSLSYPQFNVRSYVLDAEGTPAVFFHRMLVPGWVVPGARLVAGQPALPARFEYPLAFGGDAARWKVIAGAGFQVEALASAQAQSGTAQFASWDGMVRFFRERSRGYVKTLTGLNRIATQPATTPVIAVRVDDLDTGLLEEILGLTSPPALISAFLAPSTQFVFDFAAIPRVALARETPATG